MAKPKPVAKTVVCSECGLPWDAHTKARKTDPSPDVCIRLLKAELSRRPAFAQAQWTNATTPVYTQPPFRFS